MRTALAAIAAVGIIAAATLMRRAGSTNSFDWSGPQGTSKPFLTATPRGDLLLTWFEARPGPDRHVALRIVTRRQGRWSEPQTIAEHDRFFVNWADFPSATETAQGAWV